MRYMQIQCCVECPHSQSATATFYEFMNACRPPGARECTLSGSVRCPSGRIAGMVSATNIARSGGDTDGA